jgi:hypothetical protein
MFKTLLRQLILEECIETLFSNIKQNFNTVVRNDYKLKRIPIGDRLIRLEMIAFNKKTNKYDDIVYGMIDREYLKDIIKLHGKSEEYWISYYESTMINNFLNGVVHNLND